MNIYKLAFDLQEYLNPINQLAIFKIIFPLNTDQRQQLQKAFQQQTGQILLDVFKIAKFGFLSINGSDELHSLDSVYERACAVAALEATSSETFVLTPPYQQFGELLRLLLIPIEQSVCQALIVHNKEPITVVELLFATPREILKKALVLLEKQTQQDSISFLISSFSDISDAKFLIISRISALYADTETQSMNSLTTILSASMNSYISKIPLQQLFSRLILLIPSKQLVDLVNLTHNSEDLVDLEILIEKKFSKESPLVEYAFLIYIDSKLDIQRALARILRRGVKENRDFSICWVLSQQILNDVKIAYTDMFNKDCMKELKQQSSGIFKKALAIM
uniref:Annexin 16 n=1 Tax=Spironucleus barkhanus TaxID=103874 RepID=A0A142C668_SPIBA|nr:annexin 16 [Spironucleus barkhanus]